MKVNINLRDGDEVLFKRFFDLSFYEGKIHDRDGKLFLEMYDIKASEYRFGELNKFPLLTIVLKTDEVARKFQRINQIDAKIRAVTENLKMEREQLLRELHGESFRMDLGEVKALINR